MRVETSRLKPGCLLSEAVYGKTSYPLIDKNTVLTSDHIELLHAFLIDAVHVARHDEAGELFIPSTAKNITRVPINNQIQPRTPVPQFSERYQEVVKGYQRLFNGWRNNMPIDMPAVRKLFIPLIECLEREKIDIYHLHMHSTCEDYFYHHDVAVGITAAFLAKKMGFTKGEWIQIGLAGFLSNCGMAKVDVANLRRPGPLMPSEVEALQKHPVYSYRLVESVRTITDVVKLAILQHHERLDGTGYPLALQQSKIHKFSRIIAVSDTYHAMTSARAYQAPQSPHAVLTDLLENQTEQLDQEVVQVLVKHYQND